MHRLSVPGTSTEVSFAISHEGTEQMTSTNQAVKQLVSDEYEHGFVTPIESDTLPPGLGEEVIRAISARKQEPAWMLQRRIEAYRHWLTMTQPDWAHLQHPPIDFQGISYYSAPRGQADGPQSLDDVDPELLETYSKLGIRLEEQKALAGVAVDAVFDSVSVATTFRETLQEAGVIFCSMSEAVREHPELVQKYLGSVVPHTDNFFASLNSAVSVSYTHLTLPTNVQQCRSRWAPDR